MSGTTATHSDNERLTRNDILRKFKKKTPMQEIMIRFLRNRMAAGGIITAAAGPATGAGVTGIKEEGTAQQKNTHMTVMGVFCIHFIINYAISFTALLIRETLWATLFL